MSKELEIERTYLAKYLPEGLSSCEFKDIEDWYLPKGAPHCYLRIRNSNGSFVMTKKEEVLAGDASTHFEHNIKLSNEEYQSLKTADSYILKKRRYLYPYQGRTAEIAVFSGDLQGLVLIEFEFENKEDFLNFSMPDFCLVDVTQEECFAGGVLCHESIDSLKEDLDKFGYKIIG